jgi:hypothetical protein
MKKYTVEFTEPGGRVYEFEFISADIEKSIEEYGRNRMIISSRILNEDTGSRKQMLFG